MEGSDKPEGVGSEVILDCGNTPHVVKPEEFRPLLFGFLEEH